MTRTGIDIESLIVQGLFKQTCNGKGCGHQAGIQPVFAEFLQDRTRFQLIYEQSDFWVLLRKTLQKVRNERIRDRRNHTETKLAGYFVGLLPGELLQPFVLSENQPRLMQYGFALFSQHDWLFDSIENDDVQVVFNFSNLLT